MVRKLVTWIIVADGAHARLFVNEGVGKGVHELKDRAFVGSRKQNQEIQADRPGRTFDSAGQGRHAIEPRTDPQQHQEREFVREVVEWIAAEPQAARFDRLVLIAAPHALGDLRALMPKTLADKVTAEIPKNLTRARAREVESQLADVLAV